MYRKMDDLVGRTMARLGDDTTLFVMSDHGFKTFRRGVDYNAWLRDHGYLFVKDGKRTAVKSYLADIDWTGRRRMQSAWADLYQSERP